MRAWLRQHRQALAAALRRLSRAAGMLSALVIGVAFNVLGRTGGALCSDDSPFQGHGLWHLCTAIALGAWGVAAFTERPSRPPAATPAVAADSRPRGSERPDG